MTKLAKLAGKVQELRAQRFITQEEYDELQDHIDSVKLRLRDNLDDMERLVNHTRQLLISAPFYREEK